MITEQKPEEWIEEETRAGSYFVSNYPPYSFWSTAHVPDVHRALSRSPAPDTPLGIYVHIPFCRKRCHFCYFKVYTDQNAASVQSYLDSVVAELELYAAQPVIAGRKPSFIYFGGGTPSYISSTQLAGVTDAMKRLLPWDEIQEVAFECEPGTLTEGKLQVLKNIGVTRLSLGIENFDEAILKTNGRAHGAKEIDRAWGFIQSIGFPQVNIDLIAGMVGETDENWRDCVAKTISLSPDSITIYQMEVPYNTTIFKEMKVFGQSSAPVAGWKVKREWVKYAFAEFERAGYTVGSAYTVVKDPNKTKFCYRDMLWSGADMLGVGVASFSHVQGTHFQNEHELETYQAKVAAGALPIFRALTPTPEERMIRELVLQMKLGRVSTAYFRNKFGVDLETHFAPQLNKLRADGYVTIAGGQIVWSRDGLLQVDRLLHSFFRPEHCLDQRPPQRPPEFLPESRVDGCA